MKNSGRNLKRRLYGHVSELKNRLSRARYFRGHGVHSPFVYGIVRHVFMCRVLLPGDREIFDRLVACGLPVRRAIQLQNLFIYCGYATFGLNRADAQFSVATQALSLAETMELVAKAAASGATVAVAAPYEGRERRAMCCRIVAEHASTTVDNRGYLLIFNNHLPKQHFRI